MNQWNRTYDRLKRLLGHKPNIRDVQSHLISDAIKFEDEKEKHKDRIKGNLK